MRRIGFKSNTSEEQPADGETLQSQRLGRSRQAPARAARLADRRADRRRLARRGRRASPRGRRRTPPPPDPPAPTITARPADPTNQTSAHFTYADAQSGVSFQCQLDGAIVRLLPGGRHHLQLVRSRRAHTPSRFARSPEPGRAPRARSHGRSTRSLRRPPISYPDDGLTLGGDDWGPLPRSRSICGAAKDAHGVKTVLISIQRSGGGWWGGSAFDQQNESFPRSR